MMKIDRSRMMLMAAVGLFLTAGVTAWAAATRLQVFVTSDAAKAAQIAAQLDQAGYGPAIARASDDGKVHRVLTRVYDSYAEANFDKPRLVGLGFTETFAVAEPGATAGAEAGEGAGGSRQKASGGGQDAAPIFGDIPSVTKGAAFERLRIDFQPKRKSIERPALTDELKALDNASANEKALFRKAMAFRLKKQADDALAAFDAFIGRFPESPNLAKAKLMRGYWLLEKGDREAARAQFDAVARDHAGAPEAGEAALRVGYLMILAKEPDGEILKQFLRIAKGEIAASTENRVDAMLRCAALYHRGKDLDTAEAAYKAIEDAAAGDEEVRAFALMQRAGIVLEKAWNKKATFADARALCDRVLSEHPAVNKQIRATAALMAVETLNYEKAPAAMLERLDAFTGELSDTPEAPLAFYWFAKANEDIGDHAAAAHLAEGIVEAQFNTQERFGRADLNEAAKRLGARAYERLGQPAKAKALLAK